VVSEAAGGRVDGWMREGCRCECERLRLHIRYVRLTSRRHLPRANGWGVGNMAGVQRVQGQGARVVETQVRVMRIRRSGVLGSCRAGCQRVCPRRPVREDAEVRWVGALLVLDRVRTHFQESAKLFLTTSTGQSEKSEAAATVV
jgi:hypothetical protein